MNATRLLLLAGLFVSCSDGGSDAGVVQAATKGAAELAEQAGVLARKAAEAAALKGEEARVKLQELVDEASAELAAARDSEAVQQALVQLDQALVQLGELVRALGAKLDLARLRAAVDGALARFRDDPDVQRASATLRAKLDAWTGPDGSEVAPAADAAGKDE